MYIWLWLPQVVVGEKLKDGDRGLLQYYSTCEELGQCPKDSVEVRNEGIDETGRTPIWMRHNRGGLLYKLLGNTDITWSADWQQQLHTEIQRAQTSLVCLELLDPMSGQLTCQSDVAAQQQRTCDIWKVLRCGCLHAP